ncbi:MAG: glycosyltransferase, partial [Gammaproteobacteria bacterium]
TYSAGRGGYGPAAPGNFALPVPDRFRPAILDAEGDLDWRRQLDLGFDLIDAHYFYPDGVAAAMLGKYFNKPVVITARGSDITLFPQYALPRRMIKWAIGRAAGIITVCDALREEILTLGAEPAKVVSLRNGVDLQLFQPVERDSVRARLGMQRFTLLAVGHLVPVKAQELIVAALAQLPDVELFIAGNGPNRQMLEQLAHTTGVAERVRFLGALPQTELRQYYGAADALVLPSEREGWANVLLEAMACGTPVVASRVWGTPEVVAAPEAGILMAERSAQGVADAVRSLRANYPDRAATRRYAERFSWDDTSAGQLRLFRAILSPSQAAAYA